MINLTRGKSGDFKLNKILIICFIFCSVHVHAQNKIRNALFGSILFGYSVDALQDGIAFTKSPRGQDLRIIWHAAKYVHVGAVLAVGALNVKCVQKYGWKKTLLIDGVGFLAGVLVWRYTYPIYRKVNWPDWA